MNIAIYTKNAPNTYSGGRFYTMFLAIAAANRHNLFYVSNVKPIFTRDFIKYDSYKNINFIINENFYFDKNTSLDIILIVPDLTQDKVWFKHFYLRTIKKAYQDNAKILFINFETPNWFNKISSSKKDTSLWENWKKTVFYSDAVVSLTKIGQEYAEDFFRQKNLRHYYCYPPINQIAADKFKNSINKKNEIIIFARFLDTHKGSNQLIDILSSNLSGYTIKIVIGNGDIPEKFHTALSEKANLFSIKIKYLFKITDEQKFEEIASSKILLFLSEFEGYGYPPVEALYMGTHVVAKYLEVLNEVSQDNITYIKNIEDFKNLDFKSIFNKQIHYNKNIEINKYSTNLNQIFDDLMKIKNKSIYKYISLYLLNIVWHIKTNKFVYIQNIYTKIKFRTKKQHLKSTNNIMIFGTGEYAKIWTTWCKENNKNILGYIVSTKSTKTTFLDKQVFSINEMKSLNKTIVIISTINMTSALEILKSLNTVDINDIFFFQNTEDFKKSLSLDLIIKNSLELIITKKVLDYKLKY